MSFLLLTETGANLKGAQTKQQHTAKTIKLDDLLPFVKTPNVIVKIDVEGAECYVINSGKEFFARKLVWYITMEL